MLVLTRKGSEKILIGETVVSILSTSHKAVRLGIEAPSGIIVLRHELLARKAKAGGPEAAADPRGDAA